MHRSDLWEGPSRNLGIGLFCLLILAGCSRNEKTASASLTGESGRRLRALATEAVETPASVPPVAMGAAALQPHTPLQQNENGYWIVLEENALPPLLPLGANALDSTTANFERARLYAEKRDPAFLVRPAPFFDDAALSAARAALAKNAASLNSGAAIGWSFGEQQLAVTPSALPLDDDRSPLMFEVFRGWLESQYPSIIALNKQWGTKFVHWHDIVPPTTDEVKSAHNPAYAALLKQMLNPPPPPPPANPELPKDARLDDPPKPEEPKWDIRDGIKGFALAPDQWRKPGGENFSAWSDWRTFNDFVFNRLLREYATAARASGIATPLGLRNALPPMAYNTTDWSQLGRSVQWIEPGTSAFSRQLLRDLAPQTRRLTLLKGADAVEIYHLWRNWLLGDTGVVAGKDILSQNNGALASELTFIARTLEPVRQRTTRKVDPIGIYYSPRSMQLHWMLDSEADGSWWLHRSAQDDTARNGGLLQFEAWRVLLEDLGYEPGMIQPEFLLSGQLRDSKLKVLILPKVLSLSEQEAAELRAWVKRGGIVIADGACGLFDEHGKRRRAPNANEWPVGILDPDFGIQRTGATLLEKNGQYWGELDVPGEDGAGKGKDRVFLKDRVTGYAFGPSTSELRILEPEFEEAGAFCHAVSKGGAAAMLSRANGLGRMIYLNLALQDYPKLRAKTFCEDFDFEGISMNDYSKKYGVPPGGEAHRLVVGDMLGEIVLENPVRVLNAEGQPLRGVQRAHFDAGSGATLVVLLPNGKLPWSVAEHAKPKLPPAARTGPAPAESDLAKTSQPAWVSLPGNYHWYDVRTGQEVGHGDTAPITLLPDRATVLVALPYVASKVKVSTRRTDPRGQFRIQASVAGAHLNAGKHVFRTELLGPDNSSSQDATLLETEKGTANWVVTLPPDAPQGVHRLLIHDLLTGKRAEAHLLKD